MRRFTNILAGIYIVSVMALCMEVYFKFSRDRDMTWQYEWINEASWFIIFTLFLFSVMILMRPTDRSRMLAYVEELGDSDRSSNVNGVVGGGGSNQIFSEESPARTNMSSNTGGNQEASIEMSDMGGKAAKKAEKARLDNNKVKSDDVFEIEIDRN